MNISPSPGQSCY